MIDRRTAKPCPRCSGRMLADLSSGESACFTCGHVMYPTEPLPLTPRRKTERGPSHAGAKLG